MSGAGVLATSPLGRAFPTFEDARAGQVLARQWGIRARLLRLRTERDDTFVADPQDGSAAGRLLFKIDAPDEPAGRARMRAGLLAHLERRAPDLPVPRVIPDRAGRIVVPVEQGGVTRLASLLTFLEGRPMRALREPGAELTGEIGRTLGLLTSALADYPGPPWLGRLVWDVRLAPEIVDEALDCAPPEWRPALARAGRAVGDVAEWVGAQPAQACHNDVHPGNVLVDASGRHLVGLLDFGDALWAPAVCELGTALAYTVADAEDPLVRTQVELAAYRAVHPVPTAWLDALPALMAGRLAIATLIPLWRHQRDPRVFPLDRDRVEARARPLLRLTDVPAPRIRAMLETSARA